MNEPKPVPDGTLAEQTLKRVREGLAHSDTACVAQVLQVVQEMSQKAAELSVQDLADIIGRDLTTVTKVMRAANCLGYNPGAIDITTLPEAIAVIGFDKIRNLVLSLLLLETAEQRADPGDSHEVAALALVGGLAAQVLIDQTSSMSAEHAFVCAALRQYGKLLFCTFLPEEYRRAWEEAPEHSLDGACRTRFGLTPMEAGQRILAESNLPKVLTNSLEPIGPTFLRAQTLSDPDRLRVTSDFAGRLCELLAAPEKSGKDCESEMSRLIRDYVRPLALTEKHLREMLKVVDQMLVTFGRAYGLKSFSSPLIRRLHLMAEQRTWPAEPRVRRPIQAETTSLQAERAQDPLAAGLAEVKRLLGSSPQDVRKIFSVAAKAIRSGLKLRSCLVFQQEPHGTFFAATIGSGALFEEIHGQPLLNPLERDVFTVCLARGEDALIQDPSDPKIAPFVPSWFKESQGKGPLVLLPVQDDAGTFAVICGVVGKTERVDLSGARRQQLKSLRGYLSELRAALSAHRAAA